MKELVMDVVCLSSNSRVYIPLVYNFHRLDFLDVQISLNSVTREAVVFLSREEVRWLHIKYFQLDLIGKLLNKFVELNFIHCFEVLHFV